VDAGLEEREGTNLYSRSLQLILHSLLLGTVLLAAGCDGPEMPVPPPRESTNPAEDDFVWIIERMEHALKMFQPPSNLGLSIKQDLQYKVIPPSDKQTNYTAIVTITTKSSYNHGKIPSRRERNEAAKKKAAEEDVELDDPYSLPGEQTDGLDIKVPSVEQPAREVPAPVIPAPRAVEKREFVFEYVDNHWELKTKDLEQPEKMWFDYALQTGEFGSDQN
jgi:hypothetical protein